MPRLPPATHTMQCPRSMADARLYSGNSTFSNPAPFTAPTLSCMGGCDAAKKFSSASSLALSSSSSTTDTSLLGAVLRAWYGDTEIGLRMLLPLSTSVMVMCCPGILNASSHVLFLKTVAEDLRCSREPSPLGSLRPITNVLSLPSRLAALLASISPSNASSSLPLAPAPPAAAAQRTTPRRTLLLLERVCCAPEVEDDLITLVTLHW
mmetsp:Transcript_33274/g.81772  ORF Transcript_33274/g.81772 Transcript_33274/m.81772 type:complete len:208 (+) Transcript_33274:494-1117(+)